MLRRQTKIPLDYSLCCMTVTVYDPQGGRRVLTGVHYEFTDSREVDLGRERRERRFLLVIPGQDPICPGAVVVPGEGPESLSQTSPEDRLGVVITVKPQFFRGRLCHIEARGS